MATFCLWKPRSRAHWCDVKRRLFGNNAARGPPKAAV